MAKVSVSTEIPADPERVWALAIDLPRVAEWNTMHEAFTGDVPAGTLEYRTIFAVGSLLFCGTLTLNLCSEWLRSRGAGGSR